MIDILANLLNDYVDGNDDMTNLKFNEKKTMAVHPRLPVDSYDWYPGKWLFRTHFGCGENSFLSTATALTVSHVLVA